jgi:hypothetical protein
MEADLVERRGNRMIPAIIGSMIAIWFASNVHFEIFIHRRGRFERGYLIRPNVTVMVRREAALLIEKPNYHVPDAFVIAEPLYLVVRNIAALKML